jgi:hypothetical protein
MLVAGYATLVASSTPQAQNKITLFCLLGLAVTIIWLFVNILHIEKTEKPLKKKLRELRIKDWIDIESKRFKKIRIHYMTGYILPITFCLDWILFMFS